jgi:hypothetical protein
MRRAPSPAARPPARLARALAGCTVLAIAGTFLAAQIDYFRRYRPVMPPSKYWAPQIAQIWLPGLGAALVFAVAAFLLHIRGRSP